ncbi:MAG: hypothetical protein GY772_13705, partial [bacterium]|nr:hypothetical protein [bacterium]
MIVIDDAGAALVMDAGAGADNITVNDLSVSGQINLGDDSDADSITVVDIGASLSITGATAGVDSLTVDRSTSTEAVAAIAAGNLVDDDTASGVGVLKGVTSADLTFDDITVLNLQLGSGNDRFVLNAGSNLAGTRLNLDGGLGNDRFTLLELSDQTVIGGGEGIDDRVTVIIPGDP